MHETFSKTENKVTDFKDLIFQLPQLDRINELVPKSYTASFNGRPVEVHFSSYYVADRVPCYSTNIGIYHFSSGIGARIYIQIEKQVNGYLGTTYVNNYDSSPELMNAFVLKGAGRALWEVSRQIMQQYADRLGDSISHRVARQPSNGLDNAKWNELFYPLLEKNHYVRVEADGSIWEKIYYPQK